MGFCSKKFSLHHTNVGLFHSSEWSKEEGKVKLVILNIINTSAGVTSRGYLIYRLTLSLLMVSGIIAHIIDYSQTNPGYKWLIYMTNQV